MKALICDLDGTLINYKLVRAIRPELLRISCLGIITRLSQDWQLTLAEPSPIVKKIRQLQPELEIFVVTSRVKGPNSRATVERLLEKIKINTEKNHLRSRHQDQFVYKKRTIEAIGQDYDIVGIIEDNSKLRQRLKRVIISTVEEEKIVSPEEIGKLDI